MNTRIHLQLATLLGLLALASPAVAQTSGPLSINCPPNRTNWLCGVASTAIVTYPAPTTSSSCPTNALGTCAPPSGAVFILGTTTVTCRATNSCRESAVCSFTVTVARDTIPPVIQCPTNRIAWLCGTVATTTVVSWPLPTATDNADTSVAVTCSPPSGSAFPLGTSTVVCTATDNCTNRTTCTFTVTVARDAQPPSIQCPPNTNVTACVATGVVVSYPTPAATDNVDSNVSVVCSPPSGSVFPVGATTVTCTATDDCTNRTRCTFLVRVTRDTTPPSITCPTNRTVLLCGTAATIPVTFPAPTASDTLDPSVTVACVPASGSSFPVGTNTVVCTATDDCNNTSTCSFAVIVIRDITPPSVICPTNVVVSICTTCAVSQCVANVPPPIRPASVGNGLFYGSAVEPDMTFTGFNEQLNLKEEQGYHPIHVNAYQPVGQSGTASVKFGAAWVRDDDTAYAAFATRDQDAGDLQFVEALQGVWGGSRLVSLSGYKINANETRFAAAYIQDGSAQGGSVYPWRLILDRDFDQYQAEIEALAAQGYRPISVSGCSFEGVNPRYSGIFVQDGLTGSDWVTAHRIAEADYQDWIDGWWDDGFRPISVSAYTIGEETFFTAVMVRVPNSGGYVASHGMTENEFIAANATWTNPANNQYNTTFRPVVVAAYRSFYNGGAKRYAAVWRGSAPRVFSVTGASQPSLAALDAAMEAHMKARDINAASLCVSKDGGIVLHRGYTWAPGEFQQTQPCSRFRIASASKPITAIAVMKLLEGNYLVGMKGGGLQALTLDTPVFQMNGMPDLPAAYGAEARGITIRQLLQHRSGWGNGFDPLYVDLDVAAYSGGNVPLSRQDRIDFMMTPGDWPTPGDPSSVGFVNLLPASRYSNFGFSLLAELIEVVSNQSYETFVRNQVLTPVGATHTLLGRTSRLLAWSSPDEVTYTSGIGASPGYYVSDSGYNPLAIFNPTLPSVVFGGEPGASHPPGAYGRYNIETIDASGGWVATSDDLVRLLRSFDGYDPDQPGSGTPLLDWLSVWEMWSNPANIFNFPQIGDKYALGWQQTTLAGNIIEHSHGGDIDGAHSSIVRRDDGICYAVITSKDVAGTYTAINNALASITNWPVCQDGAIVTFPPPVATDNADVNVSVVCVPPSGSYFPLGFHSVTCTATDNCGNQRTCQFRVTVKADNTPPSIQCPTNRVVWTCSTNGAVVNFPAPNVSDDTDANPSVVCVPPSGSLFPVGRIVVTCTATDDCTNRSACTFTVTVNADTTRPIIYCPQDQTAWTCNPNGVPVNFPPPLVFDNHDPNPSVVCVPPSGSLFPVGTTTVTCTATDGCTNRSSCTFRVTVNRDATPPTIQCPTNIIVWSCDANDVAVNYPAPTVDDAGDATPTVVCVPPSGSLFPHGVTIVTCNATDDCSNRASCSFEVRVGRDTIPPTIECPPDRAMLACSPTGRVVSFQLPTAHDNSDASPTVNCAPPSGGVFLLGVTEVTCTALDACGNRAQCAFRITVGLDTEPPVFSCPSNIVVQTCDPRGVVVNWPKPAVTDNLLGNPQVSCTPHSGSVFPIGKTTVTCKSSDTCGNRSECSFTVTVIPDAEIPGTDTNGDGLSDIWQAHFNAHGLAPGADTDGDGHTNAEEQVAGTDPFNRASRAEQRDLGKYNRMFEMYSHGVVGKLYQIQFTPELGRAWTDIGPVITGSGTAIDFRISLDDTNLPPSVEKQAFFRFSVRDVDADGDGVTAWEESIIGTSDLSPNTHGNPGGDHQAAQDWIAGNAPQPRLREVALAHIGGSPSGPTQTKLVTATGTGGWLKLSSWTLNPGTTDPTHLQDTVPFEGWNAKLHVLEPPLSPALSLNPFVSGRLRDDGNLWLTTRRVDAAGAHSDFETLGYGANASFSVYDYAMAHRPVLGSGAGGQVDHYVLITPVMGRTSGGQKQLRIITWTVNPNTGDLNGLFDTGDLGHSKLPDDGGRLQIVPEAGSRYVVSYVNSDSELSSWFFEVNAAGAAFARGGRTSGVDIRGDNDVVLDTTDFALGALNSAGFVTLLAGEDCTARLSVWEDRVIGGDGSLFSYPFYITDNTIDQSPNDHGILLAPPPLTDSSSGAKVRGLVSDAQWEQTYGIGGGELFLQMPPNEPTNVHGASVTKCMTLLVVTELLAMPGINAALDDLVPISANAAGTGGSFMGDTSGDANLDPGERPILAGDELPLRLLLAGMMAPSCNKSARAIAEYMGAKHKLLTEGIALTTGDGLTNFVGLMNAKAMELDMNATIYGDSWGGGITTPQDLITLWREAWQHELFRTYSSATLIYADCGVDAQGEEVCFFVQKSTPWYPGLEAWKGGAAGFPVDGYEDRPFCSRCLLGQSTRLGRSLIAALQQSGDRSEDAAKLWDYGYRLLFTPDYRGGGGINTPAITDFALRKVHDTLAVSAVIYGNDQLRLDAYQVVAGIGQVGPLNNTAITINNLPVGTHTPRTKILDVTKLPTVGESEADYLTGHLDGGDLRLNVWRVGAEPGQ